MSELGLGILASFLMKMLLFSSVTSVFIHPLSYLVVTFHDQPYVNVSSSDPYVNVSSSHDTGNFTSYLLMPNCSGSKAGPVPLIMQAGGRIVWFAYRYTFLLPAL